MAEFPFHQSKYNFQATSTDLFLMVEHNMSVVDIANISFEFCSSSLALYFLRCKLLNHSKILHSKYDSTFRKKVIENDSISNEW